MMKRLCVLLGLLVLSVLLAGYSCSIQAFQPEATAEPTHETDGFEFDVEAVEAIQPEWSGTAFEIEGGQVGVLVASKWWPSKPIDVSIWYADRELRLTSSRQGTDVVMPQPVHIV